MNLVTRLLEPLINKNCYMTILVNTNDDNMTHFTKRIHSSKYSIYVKLYGKENITLIAKEM